MTLGTLAQACAYGEDENGNCLMGPPAPLTSCPFGTDISGNCIMGPLAPGETPVVGGGVPAASLPTTGSTGAGAGAGTSTSSPNTALWIIGGAIALALLLK